jgi:hypothetical protein
MKLCGGYIALWPLLTLPQLLVARGLLKINTSIVISTVLKNYEAF